MAGKRKERRSWIRWSGIGFELAGVVVGFTLVGYWIDCRYDSRPWGVLIGAMLGLVGGMYNMIRESMAAVREADERSTMERDEDS